ncbi:MAG: hypothetical protein K2I75_07190 [Clostridiales bacterium]|nr:hypothetical protein [Clostridiales bacterium]
MLIAFTVTTVILAVLYLLINICRKKIKRPDYDFSTSATKSLLIFGHVGFCISFLFIASGIISYYTWNDQTSLWAIYGIFLSFAILCFVILCDLYFTYEAIKGDEVYVRRFFKIKIINVNDIRRINNGPLFIGFYGEYDKRLFLADAMTNGITVLIGLINERKSDGANEIQEEAHAQEKAVLAKLGREYRASYKERRKKFLICFPTFSILLLSFVILPLCFGRTDTVRIVVLGILLLFALVISSFVFFSDIKTELSKDDVWLGDKYKFTNKKVKGASKHKFRMTCILCAGLAFVGATLMLPLLGMFGERPNYDEYTPVTGRIEYCREQTGKYSYIAIGLNDMPTEYRLDSIYLDEFDYSFFKEVKIGDKVTIYVDNDKDREFSQRGVSRKQWNSFYYLSSNRKEYFTYDDYVKSNEYNDMVSCVIAGIGTTIIVASAVTIPVTYYVCKRRAADEEIEIYK